VPKILSIGVFVLVFLIFFAMEAIPDFSEEFSITQGGADDMYLYFVATGRIL
jgi:hypothetical protein